MHIGLIGGIGPSATVNYYVQLVDRFRAEKRPLDLTIVQADVETLIENSLADRRHEQAREFGRLLDRLLAAGCDFAAITSLGGHFCYAETEAISPLPLLSAITPLDTFFAARNIATIGILGTETVMRTRLYGQLIRTRAVIPDEDLVALGEVYLSMARRGHCDEKSRQKFLDAGHQMIKTQNADAILLGGTDLGLAFGGIDPGYRVIDALDVHVDAIATAALAGTLP